MKKIIVKALTILILPMLGVGCGGGKSSTALIAVASAPVSETRQLEIEDRIVSTFENSTTVIQYASIVNINEGHG